MLKDKLKKIVTDNKGRLREAKDKAIKEQRKALEKDMEEAAALGRTQYEARKDEIFPDNLDYFHSEGLVIRIVESVNKVIFSWE